MLLYCCISTGNTSKLFHSHIIQVPYKHPVLFSIIVVFSFSVVSNWWIPLVGNPYSTALVVETEAKHWICFQAALRFFLLSTPASLNSSPTFYFVLLYWASRYFAICFKFLWKKAKLTLTSGNPCFLPILSYSFFAGHSLFQFLVGSLLIRDVLPEVITAPLFLVNVIFKCWEYRVFSQSLITDHQSIWQFLDHHFTE